MEQKKMALSNAIILTSILSLLVIALQIIGYFTVELEIFTIALALIPICLGSFYGGPYVGMILGGVFAVTTLCLPSSWELLKADAFATVVIFLAKGILSGYLAGLVFGLLTRVNKIFASFLGATVSCLVNTFVYLFGSIMLMTDDITIISGSDVSGFKASSYWFWSNASANFIFEFALTIFIAPLIFLAIEYLRRFIRKKYMKNKRHRYHRRPHYIEKSENNDIRH